MLAGLREGTQDFSSLVISLPPAYTYSLSFVKGGLGVGGGSEALTAPLTAEAAYTGAELGAGLMARRTPRDANAATLDASTRTTNRARLLRQGLGIAILPSQRVLKRRSLFLLIPDLLNVLPFVAMLILLTRWIVTRLCVD